MPSFYLEIKPDRKNKNVMWAFYYIEGRKKTGMAGRAISAEAVIRYHTEWFNHHIVLNPRNRLIVYGLNKRQGSVFMRLLSPEIAMYTKIGEPLEPGKMRREEKSLLKKLDDHKEDLKMGSIIKI